MNNKFILIVLQTLSFLFFLGCDQIKSRVNDSFKNELKSNNLKEYNNTNEVDKNNNADTIKSTNNQEESKIDNKNIQIKENKVEPFLLDSDSKKNIKRFNVIGIDKKGPYQSEKVKKIKSNPR